MNFLKRLWRSEAFWDAFVIGVTRVYALFGLLMMIRIIFHDKSC